MDTNYDLNVQVSQKYIIFPEMHYPFINVLINSPKTYKTSLTLAIRDDQIQRVMHFNHKNIINIHKIAISNAKTTKLQLPNTKTYFFYYEYTPFSLKQIIQINDTNETNKKVLQKLMNNQNTISQVLTRLSQYLIQQDIQYIFDLDNIGVSSQGQMKIYVSPRLFFEKRNNISRKKINNSISNIIRWWDSHMNIYLLAKIRKSLKYNSTYKPNHLQKELKKSVKPQRKSANQSYNYTLLEEKEKGKPLINKSSNNNRHNNSPSNSHNNRKDVKKQNELRIRQLRQEIMGIKKRLSQKKRHKQSQNLIETRKDLQQNYFNPYESQCFTNTIEHHDDNVGFPLKQTVQQNINCINIYTNHPNEAIQNVLANKSKKMSTQHLYSYAIAPEVPEPYHKDNVDNHNYNEFDDLMGSEENDQSVDTYDMEVEIEIEPAKALNLIYNSSTGQRQSSQRNFKSKRFQSVKPVRNNQVSNNFSTESAGPIQMKKLFNTFLKPQFYPKKSNIYEDVGQYESQTQKPIPNKKYIKQLFQAGKSVHSFHQNSSLYSKSKKQSIQDYKQKDNNASNTNKMMKKDNVFFAKNPNPNLTQEKFQPKTEKQRKIQANFASQGILKSKLAHYTNLQDVTERVNNILQKTRRALEMLSKLKQNRQNLKSNLSHFCDSK